MSLRLFIGGMRGSRPAAGSAFDEFGGDTTSLLVVGAQGTRLVLDAGTGLYKVAAQLAQAGPGAVTLLFSHYHLDHLAGLTMNPLFYKPDWSFQFVGPTFAVGGVRAAVARLLAPPYWPISWERMSARLTFSDFAHELQAGGLRVRGCPVPHPGGCEAYRVEEGDTALVFATDLEWRKRTSAEETAFLTLCREPRPADVLIIDAHFAQADQAAFAEWGHSSWQDDLDIAESACIKRVLLGHHAPDADDKTLRAREQQVKQRSPGSMLARAGQWLTIGG
jgi:ribonuclease BN (tRNA processing enzyme)